MLTRIRLSRTRFVSVRRFSAALIILAVLISSGLVMASATTGAAAGNFGLRLESAFGKLIERIAPRPHQATTVAASAKAAPATPMFTAYTVNSLADTNTGSGTSGTLRYCITQANTAGGTNTISFSVTGTITLSSSLPDVNNNLTIDGPGPSLLTISGNNSVRVVKIQDGFTVTFQDLTIANGRALNLQGGAIDSNNDTVTISNCVFDHNFATFDGGAVRNNGGNMTVTGCTFSNNTSAEPTGQGGGLKQNGTSMTVTNTTFINNSADAGGGFHIGTGTTNTTLTNCTFYGNTATFGGAVEARASGTFQNCTFTRNVASSVGGITVIVQPTTLINTIVSGNLDPNGNPSDIEKGGTGSFNTAGSFNNLIGAAGSSGFANGTNGNQVGIVDPKVVPPANYGGLVPTVPIRPSSPARNAGRNTGAPATDARGFNRPQATTVDIGAFELQTNSLVTNTLDSGAGSMRDVIAAVPAFEIVQFESPLFDSPQTISLSGGQITLSKNQAIVGPAASLLTVQDTAATSSTSRVFSINSGITAILGDMKIANNTVTTDGGAIRNGGTLTVRACVVDNNTSVNEGGGISNGGNAALTVIDSTISNNTSTSLHGGGIGSYGAVTVTGSTFVSNSASFNGGGIALLNGGGQNGSLTAINSTFSANQAAVTGGGLYFDTAVTTNTVTNCTITLNQQINLGSSGGGIGIPGGTVTLKNTIVAGNIKNDGSPTDITTTGGSVAAASSFNLIGTGGSGGLTNGVNSNQVGVANAKLIALGNYGGPTQTHLLSINSPAINAGTSNGAPTTDQRGVTRSFGGTFDIGAVEAYITVSPTTVPTGTVGTTYAGQTFDASGGSGDYTFALTGTLPAGMFFSPVGADITGTPTQSGSFPFTLTVTDNTNGFVGASNYTLTINPQVLHHFAIGTISGTKTTGTPFNITITAQDASNNTMVGFNGTVNLSTTAGTISPITSGAFASGMRTESVTVSAAGTGRTITANDGSGHTGTSNTFTVISGNSPPAITAAGPLSRQQGSTATNSQIATVSDPDQAANTLSVTATPLTGTGVTISNISIAAGGSVTANVAAACGATNSTFTLTVTDNQSATTTATLTVNITANTAPTLTYAVASVNSGSSTSNSPTAASDNGSITGYAVQSQGTYTGTISVNSSGVVSISNAMPSGPHTITIRATDNCGSTTDVSFTLTVGCPSTVVTNGNDSGAGSLRQIIANACPGSTITFQAAVTTVTLTTAELVIDKDLTINGGAGVTVTRDEASPDFRIFNLTGGAVAMNNLTITNGNETAGAGVNVNANASLNMQTCVVSGNTAAGGGGAGIFIGNGAGNILINQSTISGNTGPVIGGHGGGIRLDGNLSSGSTFTLTNSTVNNNTVANSGAGLFFDTTSAITITNSTISNNAGGSLGGGIYIIGSGFTSSTATLTNLTITGNSANNGGGIATSFTTVTLSNCLIAKNSGAGGDIDVRADIAAASSFNLIGVDFQLTGITNGVNNNQIGTRANPVNPLLGTLANNGGLTQTRALLPGSPAINTGTATGAPATDQRGIARVGNVDIGAFESRGFTMALSSGNNQSTGTSTAFGSPLAVTVTSASGETVNGGKITFTPPGSGASCTIAGNPATITGGTATTGTITANATVGGPYTVAASANGITTGVNFSLTNTNTPPAFTPAAAISRQQGSPAGSAVTVGTVSDPQTAAGSLTVTQIAGGTATGITVTGISNTNGTITAAVSASCTATAGTVRFQVSDGLLTGTGDLTVNVTANTAPILTYGAASVSAGSSTSNSATTANDNGSITSYVIQSQGSYTGTISVNSSGLVSISNAAPVGAHTITIRATDNCNATTDATFTLTVGNNPPSIAAAAALTRQRGTAGSVSTIATVSDTETAVGSLMVTATTIPAGITVTGISNTAGTITANVAADCTATLGANTVVLTVTDSNSGTATANLTVNVTANTAPTLTYSAASVSAGASTTNSPTAATDNGSITGYTLQSQGTYTGTISVNTSGVVSISGAAPVGAHTITIRATDNCTTTTDATFTLTVGNNAPTITAGAALTRQRGTAGTVSAIATVSDGETPVGSLIVTATTVPAGMTVTGITNTAGTITATVAADCTATIGANTVVLTVSDGNSGMATANLTVNVTANTAPSVTYANVAVNAGGSTSNSPTSATDNGSITGYAVQSPGTYTGTISVNSSGVVSISGAAPVGMHTITIRTTDNCTSTTDATFTLTVGNNAPTITAGTALSRQQGSTGSVATIATVSDGETAAGSLAVTATTLPAGITVTGISNSNGTITANVAAGCAATLGANTIVLTVTDGNSGTATANLTVNVTANTVPTLTYAAASVNAGGSTSNNPTTAADNGSITGYSVQSQGTYTGAISVNASGVVSISSAAPVGMHTITIRATDNCTATTDATFTLTVGNNAPTITAGAALTRQRGTAGSVSTIATVSDSETPAGSLVVTATTVPAGITVTGITNTSGTITANVAADCTATLGNNTVVLTVTDANSGTATANLIVNVTANAAPTLTYPASATVAAGAPTTVSTTTATDNGSIIGYSIVSVVPALTTAPTVNSSGVVSITNASPSGSHTITVQATDNCGATTNASFTLNVSCPAITVTAPAVSSGSVNTAFSQSFTQSGGATPITFTLNSGTLPNGLTLAANGTLAGTPTQGGSFPITVKSTDNNGCFGASATYTLVINAPPVITPAAVAAQKGGPATVAASLGTASDDLTAPNALTTMIVSSPAGISATGLAIAANGAITATIAADCTATIGANTVSVKFTDGGGLFTTTNFTVNVSANTAPTLTYTSPQSVAFAGSLNVTPTAATDNGSITGYSIVSVTPALTAAPTVNSGGVVSITNAGAPGAHAITVQATDNCGTTTNASFTLNVGCPTITLAPAPIEGILPSGAPGVLYSQQFSASGGTASYTFAVSSGNNTLPSGLTLSAAGLLSGTPTAAGTFIFTVQATDQNNCLGVRQYTLTISCPAITLPTLPNGTAGTAYNQTVAASPSGTYSYAVTLGSLPTGLTLNASSGAITGTPAGSGSFNFTITATAGACSGSRQYTVEIACTVSLPALPNATAGNAYSQSAAATPAGTYTYSLTQGSLPSGLTLNAQSGLLSGMPTVTGTYNFTIKAQAGSGCSTTRAYAFVVNCPTVTITPVSLPAGSTGTSYSQALAAAPSSGNYTFAVTTGSLPAGLSLNPATGVLSGTPTASGTFNFTVTATGFGSCTGSKAYSVTIGGGCPAITLPDLPNGTIGQMYSQSVTASPAGSYSYSQTGTLPPGLTLYATGLLFGYPAASGTYSFTITATDANNCTGSKSYSLTIGGAGFTKSVFGDFDGDGKTDFSVWRGLQSDWLIIKSSDSKLQTAQWGAQYDPYNDVIAPGDYDGDGKFDVAVFRRATSQWLIKCSKDGSVMAQVWGIASDTPVPADYDGDGKTDIAVWRGAETNWYIQRSSDHQVETVSWGTSNAPYRDVPVPADYDGDGKTDIAVFRQANGHWYIKQSSDGQVIDKYWGLGTDVPVVADYDGDGKADIAVWRGADTNWYIVRSSDGAEQAVSWGASALGDVPVPGDYDGDGKADAAIWRASAGNWYVRCSRDGQTLIKAHGQSGDTPVISKPR